MKKVLFALSSMNVGGTEKAFLNLMDTLSPEEYDVTLLLLEKSGGFLPFVPAWIKIETLDGYSAGMKSEIMDPPLKIVKNYLISGRIGRGLALLFSHILFKITANRVPYYKRVLKGKKNLTHYDTAIAFAGPFDFLSVYIAHFVSAEEKIQWIHFDVSQFHFNVETCRKLYDSFDKIYCVSDAARKSLLQKMPSVCDKTITRPNVVSFSLCRQLGEEPSEPLRKGGETILMTLGRLSSEKGQDIIPEIAKGLKEKGINFCWYLIGDGKLREIIEAKSSEYGLKENIVLLGTKTNPYPYLKQADIYVQTSVHEGFCITLAEAKAFELPIISTDCAGAHEQLDDIPRCHIVQRNDEDIMKAILSEVQYA